MRGVGSHWIIQHTSHRGFLEVTLGTETFTDLNYADDVALLAQNLTSAFSKALKVSTRGLPRDWRRRCGHPRHTWLCTLETDLQPQNLGLASVWRFAQD